MLKPFDFKEAESIAIIAFHEDKLLIQFDEDSKTYHFPEMPVSTPIEYQIKAFLFLRTHCITDKAYFVGMLGTKAFFTIRIYTRQDYFALGYAFLPIEEAYKKLEQEHKSELFYKAYELIKP